MFPTLPVNAKGSFKINADQNKVRIAPMKKDEQLRGNLMLFELCLSSDFAMFYIFLM